MAPHPVPDRPASSPGVAPQVVLHEEHLRVSTERLPTDRVVLRRRVVTEVRQVQVTVQREVLDVHRVPLTGQESTRSGPARPLVIVLSEQTPVVQLRTRPYEQVTVHVDTVPGQQQVSTTVGYEQAEVTTAATGSA